MTVEEVKAYAMKHYNDGLDVIIECWTDTDIQELIDEGGVMNRLKTLASVRNEEFAAAKYFSGEEEEWPNEYDPYREEDYDRDYIPSATNGDYSPSCPWNAPGMSIHDFI